MSLITIANDILTVEVNTTGAVLSGIRMNGIEYLWQGSPDFWRKKDANLFPYVGRLTDGHYLYKGSYYELGLHGFATGSEFTVTEKTDTMVQLTLRENEETLKSFPFAFVLHYRYHVEGNKVFKTTVVENPGDQTLHFGLGGHPGFQVPLNGEGDFTDWYLEFPEVSHPQRVLFNTTSYRMSGEVIPYELEGGRRIHLRHDLFDTDAVVLQGMPRSVKLASEKSRHSVTVDFPGMAHVGFWHTTCKPAPFVCVEPWVSLPSRHDRVEDIETQPHIIHLTAGDTYENVMTITVE